MRRLLALSLTFALLMPIPASGFLNRDCKNLAKRTTKNQATYEKAWNNYQKVLGDWINAGAKYAGQKVVESRIEVVGNAQIKILDDFLANRKCLTTSNPSYFASAKKEIFTSMREIVVLQFDAPFRNLIDYSKFVKK